MAGSPAASTQTPGAIGPDDVTPHDVTPPAAIPTPTSTSTSTSAAAPTSAGPVLDLGGRRHDLTHRALVMGILNRTPDSFYDKGATYELDALYRRAAELVADGADLLDLGGVKAGPGPDVTEPEEMERVVPVVGELVARFDAPVSIDTWRASVARASYAEGALMGNDISGFADPDYLAAATEYGAAVVATHIRLAPRVADPDPQYGDVVLDVRDFLVERAERAKAAGVPAERVVLDAGLDLGKTAAQSHTLLRASSTLAGLGYPLLLSASNKTFLGVTLGLGITERRDASLAAAALGLSWGCRILRVHDVKGTVRVRDAVAAVSAAR